MSQQPRYFSTAAKVHPSYLPQMHLQHTRRMPSKWVAPAAALMVVGYGVCTYADHVRDTRAKAQAAEERDAERRQQNEALMNEYGDRSSLEELENAIRFYEKRS